MAQAPRDQNSVPTLLAVSSADGSTPTVVYADPITHRLLVDLPGSGGTVTSVSVVTANGLAGSVATATTTPAITLSTTITGILQGNGTAISAASTTGSGAVVLATAPTFGTSITTPAVLATANDSGAIGASGTAFSDLFLASGGVINWNAGNYTLTHSAGLLTANGSFSVGTSNVVTTGTIELGDASDTTIARASAGQISVEGVQVATISNTVTLSGKTIRNTVEPATDDTYTGEDLSGILAGDTITQWDLVYLDSSSGRWEFADADAAATAGGVFLGLAASSSTDGNALTVVTRGVVRNDGWTWSGAGKPLYVSTTPAGMTETAPSATDDVVRIVAYTMSDDCIFFCPSNDWITRV